MADETAVVVPLPDPDAVVADTAALAANSAERAQEAAAATMEHAQIAVAGVAQQAAEHIQSSEERLAQWQSGIQTRLEQQGLEAQRRDAETRAQMAALVDKLNSLTPPPPPPAPEPLTSPPPEPSAKSQAEEPPNPRKRAHRWI